MALNIGRKYFQLHNNTSVQILPSISEADIVSSLWVCPHIVTCLISMLQLVVREHWTIENKYISFSTHQYWNGNLEFIPARKRMRITFCEKEHQISHLQVRIELLGAVLRKEKQMSLHTEGVTKHVSVECHRSGVLLYPTSAALKIRILTLQSDIHSLKQSHLCIHLWLQCAWKVGGRLCPSASASLAIQVHGWRVRSFISKRTTPLPFSGTSFFTGPWNKCRRELSKDGHYFEIFVHSDMVIQCHAGIC